MTWFWMLLLHKHDCLVASCECSERLDILPGNTHVLISQWPEALAGTILMKMIQIRFAKIGG